MEKDFTHILNILETLRSADLKPSAIESVITGLQIKESGKCTMSILNTGINIRERLDHYIETDLIDLYLTESHEVRLCNINYN